MEKSNSGTGCRKGLRGFCGLSLIAVGMSLVFVFLSVLLPNYRFVWYYIAFAAAIGSVFFLSRFFCDQKKYRKIAKTVMVLLSAFVLVVILVFFVVLWQICQHHRGDPGVPDSPYLIVLGSQVVGDRPSAILEERLIVALEYLESHPDTVAVLTGYQGREATLSEAEAMRRWLNQRGIPDDRLILDENARDTRENVSNALSLLRSLDPEVDNVVIVSNGFHLYRAKTLCRWNGCSAYGIAGDMPGSILFSANWYLREVLSVVLEYGEQIFA